MAKYKYFKDTDGSCKCGCGGNIHHNLYLLLDTLREALNKPIKINSGFRCADYNKKVGGVNTSQHTKGEAVDISLGSKELNKQAFNWLKSKEFDQLIDEKDYTWIHVSLKNNNNRKQILKIK